MEKVEKSIAHAALDAVRDEVDLLFHDTHTPPSTTNSKALNVSRKKNLKCGPASESSPTKFPYGWGLD